MVTKSTPVRARSIRARCSRGMISLLIPFGEKQAVLLTFDFQYIYHRWTLEKNRANLLLALELYHECQ
jgi:hypothetical protein